jgi:two-component system, NtrC family, sensor kinase
MIMEFLMAFFLMLHLRKSLDIKKRFSSWNKILVAGMAVSMVFMVLGVTLQVTKQGTMWFAHAILLGIVYVIYTNKIFSSAKPVMYAVLPYIIISILGDLVELISSDFYNDWDNYFSTASFFAVVWMVAMFIINRKQKKALEKEKIKTQEIEKENRITETLKAQLEVQVAERTAALTLQKEALEHTLTELKATQAQLIQSEKMASLGELTAGIAHEIQNPLNFVNNFSEVNKELLLEMQEEIDKGNIDEVKAIANDVMQNQEKINHHGKRADAIVKGMLQHSRTSSGQTELTDINDLADEYLRLAYHGLRAKDKSFNAILKTDFDETIGNINIIPQDIGRVILNLITNAFYAVTEKKEQADTSYKPTVSVRTKKTNDKVLISVTDNGNGIPQDILDKIFQPFFTTKPTGHGTGLGLSLSYDIIKAHNGELKVETKEGEFTAFIILLPVK